MKKGKWSFFAGIAIAGFLVAAFSNLQTLEAISKMVNLRTMPSELRMANEVGLFLLTPSNLEVLEYPIRKREFTFGLRQTFQLLGLPYFANPEELESLGILDHPAAKSVISRKDAVEALCRISTYLAEQGVVTMGQGTPIAFADYRVPGKYLAAFSFLKDQGIVKGYHDSLFHPKRALTTKECVMLFYRLYENVSSVLSQKKNEKATFVDLPLDHYIRTTLSFLDGAGAFHWIKLGPSFDGQRHVMVEEISGMLGGIMKQTNSSGALEDIHRLFSQENGTGTLTRAQLARAMELIIRKLGPKIQKEAKIAYTDVSPESAEHAALSMLGKIGIHLGYSSGKLGGNEPVTRYEVVSLMEAVLKRTNHNFDLGVRVSESADAQDETAEPAAPTPEELAKPADKSDLDNLINLIKAKQKRINKLLGRKNPEFLEK